MTDWLASQITLGNLLVVTTLLANVAAVLVNYGYQKRRWEHIETTVTDVQQQNLTIQRQRAEDHELATQRRAEDLAALRVQALADKAEIEEVVMRTAEKIEGTYARKDVLEHLVANIAQQVMFISTQVTEIRSEQRTLRESALVRTRATDRLRDRDREEGSR